mgnify:CR=1 FL=1
MRNDLFYFRRKKKISQTEMGKELGIHYTNYSTKENGNREFNLSEAKIVADRLGITIDQMYEMLTSYETEG